MKPADDPTIERVRAARRLISERCHHDPKELIAYYMTLQSGSGDRLVVREEDAKPPVHS